MFLEKPKYLTEDAETGWHSHLTSCLLSLDPLLRLCALAQAPTKNAGFGLFCHTSIIA